MKKLLNQKNNMGKKMNMCNNISLPCPRLARWAFGVQVFNEEQFVLHLTPCTRIAFPTVMIRECSVLITLAYRSLHFGQHLAHRCAPGVRIQGTVR